MNANQHSALVATLIYRKVRQMKILYLIKSDDPGGAENVKLCDNMKKLCTSGSMACLSADRDF